MIVGRKPKRRRRQRALIARERRRPFVVSLAGIYDVPGGTRTVHYIPRKKP